MHEPATPAAVIAVVTDVTPNAAALAKPVPYAANPAPVIGWTVPIRISTAAALAGRDEVNSAVMANAADATMAPRFLFIELLLLSRPTRAGHGR
ncbi:unannotated protein [freshwater metagenome]|uniref:Unannotated protein n=1 Tax=freshwater metagenome TaxID=449393 RepID=A0A6J6FY96_9ZZZZ